jgi:hypothetical protein
VRDSLELIGAVIAASEDLITITQPEWDLELFPAGEQRDTTRAAKRTIRETYNSTDARWRNTREGLGFLLSYYHGGDPAVAGSWRNLTSAVSSYIDCARAWYLVHNSDLTDRSSGCKTGQGEAIDAIDTFVAIIGAFEDREPGGGEGLVDRPVAPL